jgi:hypothetical protein
MIVYSDTHKIKNISKYTNHKTECLHVTARDKVTALLRNKTEQAAITV